MSRIYRHKQHVQSRKIMVFLVLIAIASLILFKLGFRSLINSAILIGSFGQEKTQTKPPDTAPFHGFLQLEEPATATNSAKIELEGTVQEFDTLKFYINGNKVKEKNVRGNTFSVVVDGLAEGENSVYVAAESQDQKNTSTSEIYTVIYLSKAPEVTIDSPKDGDTVRVKDLTIVGSTNPGTSLRINNQPVVVGFGGEFQTTYSRLKEGDNTLTFTATDIAGNSTTSELKITYEKE